MATYKHLRSSTANKRPTTSIADGQFAFNNNSASAGLFFKDSTGATIIKVGPVHVGTTAPNATPGAGGSSGNSTGEVWLDTSLTPVGVKIWNGSAWVNGTPTGSTTVQGLLELATDVETQAGSDAARAVTPAGLQSKVSDSISTTSSTTIASSTAVKSAYDLANAGLPKSGGTVTGNLEIGTTGSLTFEGSTADGFETTLAVVDPTGDRTITLPNISGTVVTTGDTGTVTSTMLLDGTIVNADVNASAAIAGTKIAPDFGSQTVQTTGIVSHALGTALAPTVTFTGDTNTGLYSPGADQLALATGGTGRLFVDSSGKITINNADAYGNLTIKSSSTFNTSDAPGSTTLYLSSQGTVGENNYGASIGFTKINSLLRPGAAIGVVQTSADEDQCGLAFFTHSVATTGNTMYEAMRLGHAGTLTINAAASTPPIVFNQGPSEVARIDSSGRLLVGTSASITALIDAGLQVHGTGANAYINLGRWVNSAARTELIFSKSRGAAVGTRAVVLSEDNIGAVTFTGDDGTNFINAAQIVAAVDGTPGTNDMPGRLVFSTTADGAASPTERMRITSAGNVGIGTSIGTWGPGATLDVRSGSNNTAVEEIAAFARPDALVRASINKGIVSGNGISFGTTTNHPLALRTNALERIVIGATGTTTLTSDASTAPFIANISASEVARIDSSGRLLVGTSTAYGISGLATPDVQLSKANQDSTLAVTAWKGDSNGFNPTLQFMRSYNNTTGTHTAVPDGARLGSIRFAGSDGTAFFPGAEIVANSDGQTWASGDCPGRLVFLTAPDGASSPTERFRITNDGVIAHDQPAPAAVNATATLTIANLKAGIITSTSAAATDMTLPTGTDTQAGFSGTYDNFTFEWSVINTGPSLVRVLAGTAHTVVGSGSVATGTSGRFTSRRTATNTFVTYRLS